MEPSPPSDNLYVSNLPAGIDEGTVNSFFSFYGTVVSSKVLPSPIPNGKISCLVRFSSVEVATVVLQTLHNTVPPGMTEPVHIKYAQNKRDKERGAKKDVVAAVNVAATAGSPFFPAALASAASSFAALNGAVGGERASPYPAAVKAVSVTAAVDVETPCDAVFVQGLPPGTTDDSVRETFGEFGEVHSLKLLALGPDTPCSALIKFVDAESAKIVKQVLHGAQPDGFPGPLNVKFANEGHKPAKAAGGSQTQEPLPKGKAWEGEVLDCDSFVSLIYRSGALPGGQMYSSEEATIYVGGLPVDITDFQLYKMFSPYGAIHSCAAQKTEDSTSIAVINYLDPLSADAAITAYNGMQLPDGSKLEVTTQSAAA